MPKIEGRCLCGDVRFAAEPEAIQGMSCYCKDCQRATGSSCATFVVVPEPALEVHGEPSDFTTDGDSGRWVKRSFCGRCGSQLWSRVETMPGAVFVKIGVMDDNSDCAPGTCIWTQSKPAWAELPEGLPSFEKNPGG